MTAFAAPEGETPPRPRAAGEPDFPGSLEGSALVLEGGGLRGVYTSGVLHLFMRQNLYLPYVIGVSMGACNAANYISRQPERNRAVNIPFVRDPRYLSYRRLLTRGELFGMDFIFRTIPEVLVPFDFKTFRENRQRCITTVTDCETGQPLYFDKDELGDDYLRILQASSSLPFIARPVPFRGRLLMDGGLSDSIPLGKSLSDGNRKHVLVLTRPRGYRKTAPRLPWIARLRYPHYRGLQECLRTRHIRYNETMEEIERLEAQGRVFVIRPDAPLKAGRVERNMERLYAVYDQGYRDAEGAYPALYAYLNSPVGGR